MGKYAAIFGAKGKLANCCSFTTDLQLFGVMLSSLISHQWEGDFPKAVIAISSNKARELTPTPAATYCRAVARLVLAVTFPKSPLQFEQLWVITSSSSLNEGRVDEGAKILHFHGFVRPCANKTDSTSVSGLTIPRCSAHNCWDQLDSPKLKTLEPSTLISKFTY